MVNQNSFQIISMEEILIEKSSIPILDFDQKKIDQIWKNESKKKNNKLFNGKVLTYKDSFKKNNQFIINGSFIDYKIVLSSLIEPKLGLKIKPIGVSGIIIVTENAKKFIIFSSRSTTSTEYPGFLELVPSGHIDDSTIKSDGTIDYTSKLIEEFTEETGLKSECIQNVSSLCFVLDKNNQVYDVCSIIKIINTKENIINNFKSVSEYGKPELVPINSLSKFVEKNYHRIIPTSLAILSCFNKNHN